MTARNRSGPTQRQLRVGEEIRHVLAGLFMQGELHDPALRDVSLTVTEVRPSPDLKNATVFVIPLGGVEAEATVAALNHAAGFIGHELGRRVHMKFTPHLTFVADRSFEEAERIERVLRDPHVAQDLDGDNEE